MGWILSLLTNNPQNWFLIHLLAAVPIYSFMLFSQANVQICWVPFLRDALLKVNSKTNTSLWGWKNFKKLNKNISLLLTVSPYGTTEKQFVSYRENNSQMSFMTVCVRFLWLSGYSAVILTQIGNFSAIFIEIRTTCQQIRQYWAKTNSKIAKQRCETFVVG